MNINASDQLNNCAAIVGRRDWPLSLGDEMRIERFEDDVLDLGCGNAGHRSDVSRPGLSMQARQRHIIAIADAGLGRMGRHHAVTGVIEQQSGQQVVAGVPDPGPGGPLIRELLLDRIEQGALQDRRLLAGQDVALVSDLADIEAVAQQIEQRTRAGAIVPSTPSNETEKRS